jgi:hypothetical protein
MSTCSTFHASLVLRGRSIARPLPYLLITGGYEKLEHLKLGVHIWVSVLIMGTMWRLVSYHLIASRNPNASHIGRAMSFQY